MLCCRLIVWQRRGCDLSSPDFCLPYLGYNAFDCEDIHYRNFTVVGEDINYFDWDTTQ